MLLSNLQKQTILNYICSHPILNSIFVLSKQKMEEEVMEFYITFIKALTLRIDETTVGFFFNEVNTFI